MNIFKLITFLNRNTRILRKQAGRTYIKASVISILLLGSLFASTIQNFGASTPSDIAGHWSESFVTSLVNQGVISGYPDGSFKPDKSITGVEYLSLIIKAMGETIPQAQSGETWDMPIVNKAISLGLIESGESLSGDLTRERAALISYKALQIKEGIEYDQCYTRTLDQCIFDNNTIDKSYKDAVYSMLQKGVFTGNANHFYPKNLMTRGASCVVIDRIMDEEKREWSLKVKNGVQTWVVLGEPVESENSVQMPFEKGKPVIDKEKVFNELWQYENNNFNASLDDYYFYEDYIKRPWYGGDGTVESKRAYTDKTIEIGLLAMKTFYNFDYRNDQVAYKKALQWVSATYSGKYERIETLLKDISENNWVMESEFVTDKDFFYYASDHSERLRGRLYFTFKSPSQNASLFQTFHQTVRVPLKTDQWYYIDCEITVGDFFGTGAFDWEHSTPSYGTNFYLSDFIPVTPLN